MYAVSLIFFMKIYLHTTWSDLSHERQGRSIRVGEVDILQLNHHLSHHVVPAVTVEAEHHKVQCQNLK